MEGNGVPVQWSCGSPRKQWLFVKFATEGLDMPDRSTEQVEVRIEPQAVEPSRSKKRRPRRSSEATPGLHCCHLGRLPGAQAQPSKTIPSQKIMRKSPPPSRRSSTHGNLKIARAEWAIVRMNTRSNDQTGGGGSGIGSGSHHSREDPKDGIHGGNFSTLVVMVA